MKSSSKPFYTHDCVDCQYLGAYKKNKNSYDLYFCPKHRTVIARYGDEEFLYTSSPIELLLGRPERYSPHPLVEALRRLVLKRREQ